MSTNAKNRNYFCTNLIVGCWISWDSFISPYLPSFLSYCLHFFFSVTQDVVYPGECSMCTWEEGVFCIWMEYSENINEIHLTDTYVSFKTFVFLLIFCFDDLSIGVIGVLKSPTIIVWLSISPFMSVSVCLRRRQWHPTPVLLPGKSHGRRSLVGCSPWGR